MTNLLHDLYTHQAWADAEHWKALEAHPAALEDDTIRKRLHHLYEAQRAFLFISRKIKLDRHDYGIIYDMPVLKDLTKCNHEEAAEFLNNATDEQLNDVVTIPWFKDPPISITIEQALTQTALHSHYHRGQNAARLRELGGNPPLTDFILWLWKEKPEPEWK
jgi:uncharacterized damage-inducible protein DinB